MASARTAVGRTVQHLDSVRISRNKMGIPIRQNATGQVNELDDKACRLAIASALNEYFKQCPPIQTKSL